MPYTGADDPDLPSDVQDMSEDDREQWVAVFNSAFERCQDEGLSEVADDPDEFADCEAFAFANAYGVVNQSISNQEEKTMKISPMMTLYRKIRDVFKSVLGDELKEFEEREAISVGKIYGAVYAVLEETDWWVWILDLYIDDGNMFALFVSESKLFRVSVEIEDDNEVVVGEWLEIDLDATKARTRVLIVRQDDGRVRWISISATAVLNRSGEIDSKALFDSFVAHAEDTGEYPYRTFYHQDEVMKMGQADYLARDGDCYITSGLYDEDCPLADAEIAAREREPDYWGESIGFTPTSEPDILKVTEDVGIPVYETGIHIEISTVSEADAAAWFTHVLNKEVLRMRPNVKEKLLELTDGDETLVEEFEAKVDSTNREIDERELITREGKEDPPVEPKVEPGDEDEDEDDDTETGESQDPPVEPKVDQAALLPFDVEIDDEAVERIADVAVKSEHITSALKVRDDKIDALQATLDAMSEKLDSLTDLPDRVEALELDEDEKRETWLEDQPNKKETTKVTYRPREEKKNGNGKDEPSMQDLANETLESLPQHK